MNQTTRSVARAWTTFVLAAILLAPTFALFSTAANAQDYSQQPLPVKKGMSMRTKVLLLGGAALLYYLYRKHQAKVAAQTAMARNTAVAPMPQLYRSRNGGVYYRDAQHRPIWLTLPNQSMQIPASDVQQYAPDYRQYNGPAPAAPSGYQTQPFSAFDPSVANAQ